MNWDDPAARAALIERVGVAEYSRRLAEHLDAATVAIVNGHRIRHVSTRFGTLYAVGNTGQAFYSLAEAKRVAASLGSDARMQVSQ